MRKLLRTALIVFGVLAISVLLYDAMGKIAWVGSTELTIDFVVTDAETGQPLEGAVLEIDAETTRYLDGRNNPFQLTTDPEGTASYVIPNCMCAGMESNLRILMDRRSVNIPAWRIGNVVAPGNESPEPFWLTDLPHRTNTKHTGPGKDHLVVPISLRKLAK